MQDVIREEGLLDRVSAGGHYLRSRLEATFGQNPYVGDIRGRGYLQALELVNHRDLRTPFDPALSLNARVKAEAFARGLLVYPGGGTIDGRSGDHVLLAPPYITSDDELDLIVDRLDESLKAALASIGVAA